MSQYDFPLLIFPQRAVVQRDDLSRGAQRVQTPPIERQRERIAPQFAVLRQAMEGRRLTAQPNSPVDNPELVLVMEVIGTITGLARAVRRIEGMEWLFELMEDQIAPDEDFKVPDSPMASLNGRIFLVGSNKEALDQLIALWQRYDRDHNAPFERNFASFKNLFKHLKTIRYWDVSDRLEPDVIQYWEEEIESGKPLIRFEIEAWYFKSIAKNAATVAQIRDLAAQLGGSVIQEAHIHEIAYQGILVELPREAIEAIVRGERNDLLLSDRIMYFKPRPQCLEDGAVEEAPAVEFRAVAQELSTPVLALLDGFPMANHALLQGRLAIDDPDGWSQDYEAKDRVHGTAMASLIIHGELDGDDKPLDRLIYVRPVLRPDAADTFNDRRGEIVPDNVLLIDLIHRAVRRVCEGEAGQNPVAPSVRIFNISLGDSRRAFSRDISPWARLIDWLSHKYNVLFIVSAGNDDANKLEMATARGTLSGLAQARQRQLAMQALLEQADARRLISPAEAMNAVTVGALHADSANPGPVHNRFDLFDTPGVSPVSRVGHGYKRSIKPDLLAPGGRCLHSEAYIGDAQSTVVELVHARRAPGMRVAVPPLNAASDPTAYCRGTSNAAAMTSRVAVQIYDALEVLRQNNPVAPGNQYDAVLIKALLLHGTSWGELPAQLLAFRPDLAAIQSTADRHRKEKDFLARWLGHGMLNSERSLACTAQRATLIGVGTISEDGAFIFSAPLPPSLAGTTEWRRMTITLAWLSPMNHAHQSYRRARLWATHVGSELGVDREKYVDYHAARRGTVQHEIYEGDQGLAFVDGDTFSCQVNCAKDAGSFNDPIRFCLCVSLEVGVESAIPVYQEIRDRIKPPVQVAAIPA